MGWSKVCFDHRLLFSTEAKRKASKSQKAAVGPSMLVKIIRALKAFTIRKAIHVSILLILTYRWSVWWPVPI